MIGLWQKMKEYKGEEIELPFPPLQMWSFMRQYRVPLFLFSLFVFIVFSIFPVFVSMVYQFIMKSSSWLRWFILFLNCFFSYILRLLKSLGQLSPESLHLNKKFRLEFISARLFVFSLLRMKQQTYLIGFSSSCGLNMYELYALIIWEWLMLYRSVSLLG